MKKAGLIAASILVLIISIFALKTSAAEPTGWLNYQGNWYYLNPATGNPVTGVQVINGTTYTFNANAVCIG